MLNLVHNVQFEEISMAKKRYYQSAKDRLDESRGMEREIRRKDLREERERLMKKNKNSESRKKMMNKDYYAGMDARRRQEMEDAGMIREDHSAIANLPQGVIMREYPKNDYFSYNLNDDIRGIDVQMDDDVRKESKAAKARHQYPEKY